MNKIFLNLRVTYINPTFRIFRLQTKKIQLDGPLKPYSEILMHIEHNGPYFPHLLCQ